MICEQTILDKVLQLARCVILEQIEGLPKHHLLPGPILQGCSPPCYHIFAGLNIAQSGQLFSIQNINESPAYYPLRIYLQQRTTVLTPSSLLLEHHINAHFSQPIQKQIPMHINHIFLASQTRELKNMQFTLLKWNTFPQQLKQ